MSSRTVLFAAFVAVLAALGIATTTVAFRPAAASMNAPANVGVVNLSTIVDRMKERQEWDVRLKSLESAITEEGRARRAKLEATAKEIEPISEGTERESRIDQFRMQEIKDTEWLNIKKLEIDRERSLKWQSLYRSIREGTKKLSEREGLDLVIVDDSKTELRVQRNEKVPMEAQALEQIASLRVLFGSKAIDVTEKLLVQIDNDRSLAAPANSSAIPTNLPAAAPR
ncbi:MAG: OmpH family outer membrane protein [Phycisphaerales bacterium]|nr:OmpH family outer membrane protein [Phycisphaerales bacterium]